MTFDSRPDTYAHIQQVQRLLNRCSQALQQRGEAHDASKLQKPERSLFDEYTPKLATMEYGSAEYKAALQAMGPALQHHYAANSHHPEHYPDGIQGMTLIDVLEMLCDWEAAARRKDGHARPSIDAHQARFGFSDELKAILINTLPLLEKD